MSVSAPEPGRARRAPWLAWAGFVLGVVLLIAAVMTVLRGDTESMREVFGRLRGAPWWALAVIFLGPVLNWLLISSCLWLLQLRHGKLGWGEMNALVGSAWLLNHLPMRPGLIGRVGYHRVVNGIRVRDSIESTVWSLVLAGVCGAMALGLAFALPEGTGAGGTGAALAGPIVVVGLLAAGCKLTGRRTWSLLLGALAVRFADLGLWAVRYAVVFWVMGMEVGPIEIVVVTGASQVAQLVPIAGGGLGLREWFVAITAGSFGAAFGAAFDAALAADLINRVAETLAVIPVGLIGTALIAKRFTAVRKNRLTEPEEAAA